jgi:putative addiction module component (TIGR02574 family)
MSPAVDAIFDAALALPAESRAAPAEKLLESLDKDSHAEIDAAWANEAESRVRAYEKGEIKAILGPEVLHSLIGL